MKNKILSVILTIAILLAMLILLTGCTNQTSAPETELAKNIYEEAQESLNEETEELNKLEADTFNKQFEFYKGDKVKGSSVSALITTIQQSNDIHDDKKVEITGDVTKKTDVQSKKTYKVEFNYNSSGIIDKVVITNN